MKVFWAWIPGAKTYQKIFFVTVFRMISVKTSRMMIFVVMNSWVKTSRMMIFVVMNSWVIYPFSWTQADDAMIDHVMTMTGNKWLCVVMRVVIGSGVERFKWHVIDSGGCLIARRLRYTRESATEGSVLGDAIVAAWYEQAGDRIAVWFADHVSQARDVTSVAKNSSYIYGTPNRQKPRYMALRIETHIDYWPRELCPGENVLCRALSVGSPWCRTGWVRNLWATIAHRRQEDSWYAATETGGFLSLLFDPVPRHIDSWNMTGPVDLPCTRNRQSTMHVPEQTSTLCPLNEYFISPKVQIERQIK